MGFEACEATEALETCTLVGTGGCSERAEGRDDIYHHICCHDHIRPNIIYIYILSCILCNHIPHPRKMHAGRDVGKMHACSVFFHMCYT